MWVSGFLTVGPVEGTSFFRNVAFLVLCFGGDNGKTPQRSV
jgi:hypothetical protein